MIDKSACRSDTAFTIIEILLVVALISVMIAIYVPKLLALPDHTRGEIDRMNALQLFKDIQAAYVIELITLDVSSRTDVTQDIINAGVSIPLSQRYDSSMDVYFTPDSNTKNVYFVEIVCNEDILYSNFIEK